jgi:hypothetical protein
MNMAMNTILIKSHASQNFSVPAGTKSIAAVDPRTTTNLAIIFDLRRMLMVWFDRLYA